MNHYSVSQMNMFWRCPLQYMHRYVEGRKVPPGVIAIVGKGGHKSVEKNLSHKIQHGILLPDDAVGDIAADAVNAEWDTEPPRLSPEDASEGENIVRGRAVDRAVSLAKLHHVEAAPNIVPVAVEREWRLHTPLDIDLVGIIDVCEPACIRDTKFKSKSPTQAEADGSLQFTSYHLARTVLDKLDCELRMDALVSTKTPKYISFLTTRSDLDHRDFLNRLWQMDNAIKKGVFMPCQRDHWCCSEKWCGYFNDVCPYGRRARERVTT